MGIKWCCCFFLFLWLCVEECFCVNLEGTTPYTFKQNAVVDPYGILNNRNPNNFQDKVSYHHEEYESFVRVNRKVGCALRRSMSSKSGGSNSDNLRRKLIEQVYNLPALVGNSDLPIISPQYNNTISMASGAFPASENSKDRTYISSSAGGIPLDLAGPFAQQSPQQTNSTTPTNSQRNSKDEKLDILLITVASVLFAIILLVAVLVCCRRGRANISPWRTGISGQLQKAFVTGVQKLNKSELELACGEFCNIIITEPEYTVFKGTLSNGTEIAVVSTAITSQKDWSNNAESCFRRKINMLSRVNHKNFINLLGYCEEEEPFMRMMVFEYAPNGTLCDNLYIDEFERLSWEERMRIIMGMSYCLEHMHHDLDPPIALPYLQSNTVFLTEDNAAMLSDMSVWKEVISLDAGHRAPFRFNQKKEEKEVIRKNMHNDGQLDRESVSDDCSMNIYNFGIILLEIISGKLPRDEDVGAHEDVGASLLNWAMRYLDDGGNIKQLVDPTLTEFQGAQLETICEVIRKCVNPYSENRPTMREITKKLRSAIDISPQAAHARLSPLWWAELEILSDEI